MGPNIPSFTDAVANASSGANLGHDVANLAPLATTWHGPQTGVNATFIQPQTNTGSQGVLAKFEHFIGGVASGVGHLAEGATSWLAHQAVNMAEAPIKLGEGYGHAILDNMSFNSINAQSKQNSDLLANVTQAYKSGRMTAQEYSQALKGINQDNSSLVSQTASTRNQTSIDQKATVQATWDTAATLVTVLTAGLGSATATAVTTDGLTPLAVKSAGDFLASTAAKPFLSSTEEFISRVASQPEVFNALSDTAKMALQRSTAEVVASGAKMSAAQIARASAANLALKYPLYYGTIAPTGSQIYHELDNGKYGDAVRTLAFNAALLLSGGPIGHALKYGGDAIKGVSAKMFGQTSFWDELSKFYGDGSPQGFRDAVVKATANMSQVEKDQFVRNLSAVEHTNVAAMGGDSTAAANRVASGMTANEGVSLSSVTHDDALSNMVNFAEAQRLADTAAKDAGLGKVAVGRVDARALNEISAKLVNTPDSASRLQAWETLKQENPTQAWANNSNFDTQIKNLITKHEDVTSLDTAIRGIKAQFSIKGFPEAAAKKLSKMGYIPIKPIVNEAPFAEGSGKLYSKFGGMDVMTSTQTVVPPSLKTLYDSAKSFATESDFIAHLQSQKTTQYETIVKEVEKTQNVAPLKHFTTPEVAAKLKAGEKFDYNEAPLHGVGGKEYGQKVDRFVDDGKPTMYLSLDDSKWNAAHIPTGKPTDVIENFTADDIAPLQKQGYTASYDYDKQKYIMLKDAYDTKTLTGVNYFVHQDAKKLTIDSVDKLKSVISSLSRAAGKSIHPDSPGFWPALRKQYDVVNIVGVDKNRSAEGLGKWFTAAKGDQSIVLNTKMASTTPFKSVEQNVSKVAKDVPKQFNESAARQAYQLSKQTPGIKSTADDIWTKSVQPVPILGHIGSMLTGMGLSPNASTQQVYQMYNTAMAKNLAETSLIKGSKMVGETAEQTTDTMIKRLSEYMHTPTRGGIEIGAARLRAPMTDLRQLSTKDIMTALDVSAADAKEVGNAIMQSMLDVPLAVRGLGDKAVDYFQKVPGISTALRTQGALRFAWNPIFRAKVSTKIEILAQAEANGKFPTIAGTNKMLKMIFPEEYSKIDGMRQTLRDIGALDEKPGFGVAGEATDAVGMSANLNHKLTVAQERSVSSLVLTQAKKAGVDGETFVKQFPQQVRDTVQMITQYDRNANFLNSPMARTLNFAFFPFRFETKVATIMAKSLARTDNMTQFAVIKGLYNAHDFLNSPEGQAWYSQNSDVIKLAEYFTPIQTLGEVATALGGKADSISNFGELGGLPFGFIPMLLDNEGLTHITQSAYLDPKTGKELPSYIPATDKGRLLVAIQSLLGSMFSYPGSELGLPSKSSITQNVAMGLTGGHKSVDMQQAPMEALSSGQLSFQQAVQAANPQPAGGQSTTTFQQQNKPVQGQSVQAQPTSVTQPIPKTTGGSSQKKKKADFTPALMPGQSQLGVIPGVR